MIPAGTYYDIEDKELILVRDYNEIHDHYPYNSVESSRGGWFRPYSARARSLVPVPDVTSTAQLKLQYPELFI